MGSAHSATSCTWSAAANTWEYDDKDGRVTKRLWAQDSTGFSAQTMEFDHALDDTHGGNGVVFKRATLARTDGATTWERSYEYFYDAFGRRRLKSYPLGMSDEFFYSNSKMLLEDRGFRNGPAADWSPMIDEYIWLDGRPVAMLRSELDELWIRQPDMEGDCWRGTEDEASGCGAFFLVTDHIGKPVLTLDSNLRVAGAGDYQSFGYVNRMDALADTAHPYPGNYSNIIAELFQPVPNNQELRMRVRFHFVDTEREEDFVSFEDDNGNALQGPSGPMPTVYGPHVGPVVTPWARYEPGHSLNVRFTTSSNTTSHSGAAIEAVEYQRFERDVDDPVKPFFPPIRFPGQYHDQETDLFENWNRYYDPSTGRYLQPEPVLALSPTLTMQRARDGLATPSYAYASNNPLTRIDDDGFLDRQYKKDGSGNETVRKLEKPIRDRLVERCAKEKEDNRERCKESKRCQPPPTPDKFNTPAEAAAHQAQADTAAKNRRECERGAECEYRACVAGATSASGTYDYQTAWARCMNGQ